MIAQDLPPDSTDFLTELQREEVAPKEVVEAAREQLVIGPI